MHVNPKLHESPRKGEAFPQSAAPMANHSCGMLRPYTDSARPVPFLVEKELMVKSTVHVNPKLHKSPRKGEAFPQSAAPIANRLCGMLRPYTEYARPVPFPCRKRADGKSTVHVNPKLHESPRKGEAFPQSAAPMANHFCGMLRPYTESAQPSAISQKFPLQIKRASLFTAGS